MQLDFDLVPTLPIGQRQHQARPEDIAGGQGSRLRPAGQLLAMFCTEFGHSVIASHINETPPTSIGYEMTGTVH